jgi:acid phosphatase family membrane protein YuiD
LNFLTLSLTTSHKKFQTLEDVQKIQFWQGLIDLVMVEEVWNVDSSGKEAKTINKVIEQVTSNSTTFRQFFRLFPNGGMRSHLSAVPGLVQSLAI